jgi:simple sugar transport system permease protein
MAQQITADTKAADTRPDPPTGRNTSIWETVLYVLAQYREASIAAVAIVLVVYIQWRTGALLSTQEMSVVLRDTGQIGMIAGAIVLVMITGEIDLSVGGTYVLAPYLMTYIATTAGLSIWLTAALAILMGVCVGLTNSLISVKLRVPSLITTLGTFFLLSGIAVSMNGSQQIDVPSQEPFNEIFGESLYSPRDPFWSWHTVTNFTPFLWALAVVLILTLVLTKTRFGLHIIATGSNLIGAREIGVRTDRIKIYCFMILGAAAAFSGIITALVSSSVVPAENSTVTLQSIAAAVIGGTSLFGGSGTVIGALIGAFVVALLNDGLILLGVQANQADIFLGTAIILAMILNVWVNRLRQQRRG